MLFLYEHKHVDLAIACKSLNRRKKYLNLEFNELKLNKLESNLMNL